MSDFFDQPPRPAATAPRPPSRRPSPLLLTGFVLAGLFILATVFTGIYTEKLWFDSVDYTSVFTTQISARVGMFVAFGLIMAVVVGVNLLIAYRTRPMFTPRTPDQANLDRYREAVAPMRKLLFIGLSLLLGLFAGLSASGEWRTYLMWRNGGEFGESDPYLNKDIGFYFFDLPWFRFVLDFGFTVLVIGLLAALLTHYLYGGIRLSGGQRLSGAAQAQLSVVLGLLLVLKAGDYWLDRFDLNIDNGSRFTGMSYTRETAMLPSKNILIFIALICAVLLFVNVVRRTWTLPVVSLALLGLSAVLLGMVWPALVQRFSVLPSEADKEAPYIRQNIEATRDAYDVADTTVTPYSAQLNVDQTDLRRDAASLPGIRLVDPEKVSETFQQLQQVRGYYAVPNVLDVDRYDINGRDRDLVVSARELNQEGLPASAQNWANLRTVYTHGYGIVAAYGNQRDADDQPVADDTNDGDPVWAERDIPPTGELSELTGEGYRPQIYYGEQSPEYSIVGKRDGARDIELDIPEVGEGGQSQTNTYDGETGVDVNNTFRKLLYAIKFSDANIVLSSRVHENSKILYDRAPVTRVEKVAPWLTVDSDALPAVVDGRIVWILDGYTVSDKYPLSEKRSLQQMVNDSLTPVNTFGQLPTDNINYMRNSVKAVVDAYDGTVDLYAWDEEDPLLDAWRGVFPDSVQDFDEIPEDLKEHMRYPEQLFKVQRNILADYHVTNPKAFYENSDKWDVPQDPSANQNFQPPYRLSVSTESGQDPVFSLTSVYVPTNRQNLAAFMSVGADGADPDTYGEFNILRLPDTTQVPGPSQIKNRFDTDQGVADALLPFKQSNAREVPGNLLTLPVGGGLLYVQPLYTQREGGTGTYPQLRFVVVSFGNSVGIGKTLDEALDSVLGEDTGTGTGGVGTDPGGDSGGDTGGDTGGGDTGGDTGGTPAPDATTQQLLDQANAKFQEADRLLRAGNLEGYARAVQEAQDLVQRAADAFGSSQQGGG